MKIAIIIPTYNEVKNIKKLIEKILKLNLGVRIIIVDDNSPDKTKKVVEEITKKNKDVELILRTNERGRGSAVIEGLKLALKDEGTEYFFEMDADFSHDPKDISRILEKIKHYDVVIGSRYMPSSKIINWSIKRRVFSRFANFYARLILGIPISDYTNGYRCYNRRVLKSLDFSKFKTKGYIVLSEMAYKIHKSGFKFGEIPIVFLNRKRGMSNLKLQEISDALTSVLKIRFSK
ncbi:polyprenol monophosphomannose synthase [Patescibacteria group bacterium]|nr:polyprenol monophosphomannose synthase [Patescibacteria group bacterium]MBU4056741.1 polyprenol monophosphomannose synthase [Patescibacteria group bacterium]MBU4368432.1 polyprenol monophosphomannose synthase [Patescibacteria group bacterium]